MGTEIFPILDWKIIIFRNQVLATRLHTVALLNSVSFPAQWFVVILFPDPSSPLPAVGNATVLGDLKTGTRSFCFRFHCLRASEIVDEIITSRLANSGATFC